MKRKSNLTVVAALLLMAGVAAPLRADEIADKGRGIFEKNSHAIVTVQLVLKMSAGGSSSRSQEDKRDLTGTVIDPSGLTVVALSSADPAEMTRRLSEELKLETEVSDVKLLMEDGTEVPSEIVLRDKDLDLAFIRPKVKPTTPMTAVDLSKSSPAQILDQVVTLNRLNRASGRAYSASTERISAVVQKPRTFYIPDSNMSGTALGSPAFAMDGNVLGVLVLRVVSLQGGGGRANMAQGMTSIILPAEDILKASKQAPEAKGEEPKKDAPKEESKSGK